MKEGYAKHYSDEEIKRLLNTPNKNGESNLHEDKLIKADSGNHDENFQGACLNYELRDPTRAYQLFRPARTRKMTDEELLADAYRELKEYESKRR